MNQSYGNRGRRLRFALIGAGRIGAVYCQAFQSSRNAELAAIVDTYAPNAQPLGERFNCKYYPSHRELAESEEIDAVVVATPPDTHAVICSEFLDRGIAVLCEKPVSIDVESAKRLERQARERKLCFTMASKFRYVTDVVRARNIVDSGILGEIVLFENTFTSFVEMSTRWNANKNVAGGGVLIDNGTHSVDVMRYFIGPLRSIHVVGGPQIQGLPVEETVYVTARSVSGAVGRMDLSWSIQKPADEYIAIYGSKGTLRVGWKESFYRQTGNSEWIRFGTGYNKVDAFSRQIENFSASVQGLERLVIEAADAIASVEVINAGYVALETGAWVEIPGETELLEGTSLAA